MGKKKIKKKSEGGDIKVKKIDPLSERLDKAGLRGGVGKSSRPTLNKKDKQVIDAFYKGKEASSNKLTSDGKTLEIMGLGRQNIAKRDKGEFGDFNITAKPSGRTTQSILRYIKKTFPKDRIKKDATKMVKQEDSFLTRYSGKKLRDKAAKFLDSKNIKYEKTGGPSSLKITGVSKSQRSKLMDKIKVNQDKAVKLPKKKNKGGLLVTPKLAKRGF
jgi:hypothetical protein